MSKGSFLLLAGMIILSFGLMSILGGRVALGIIFLGVGICEVKLGNKLRYLERRE